MDADSDKTEVAVDGEDIDDEKSKYN